jgi:hypothetical protein
LLSLFSSVTSQNLYNINCIMSVILLSIYAYISVFLSFYLLIIFTGVRIIISFEICFFHSVFLSSFFLSFFYHIHKLCNKFFRHFLSPNQEPNWIPHTSVHTFFCSLHLLITKLWYFFSSKILQHTYYFAKPMINREECSHFLRRENYWVELNEK